MDTAVAKHLLNVPLITLVCMEEREHYVGHVPQDFGRISLAIDVFRKLLTAITLIIFTFCFVSYSLLFTLFFMYVASIKIFLKQIFSRLIVFIRENIFKKLMMMIIMMTVMIIMIMI